MLHFLSCIEELLAEIDTELARTDQAKALAQLDAREAEGDKVSALDGTELRRHIAARLAALPLAQARAKLIEARAIVVAGAPETDIATPSSNVIRLAEASARREAASRESVPAQIVDDLRPVPQFKSMRERLAMATGASLSVALALLTATLMLPLDAKAPSPLAASSPIALPLSMAPVDATAGSIWQRDGMLPGLVRGWLK